MLSGEQRVPASDNPEKSFPTFRHEQTYLFRSDLPIFGMIFAEYD